MTAEMHGLLTAGAFFLTAACAQEPTAPPPFVSGESLSTETLHAGTWTYETARWEDGILRHVLSGGSLVLERVRVGEQDVWRSVGETHYASPGAILARDTLWFDARVRPIRQVWHYERGRRGSTVLDLSYGADSVLGVFQDFTGHLDLRREARIALPSEPIIILPSYNLSGLAHVLTSIPLSRQWAGTFQTVINGRTPVRASVSLAVVGDQRITVPAGTFDAWHLRVVGRRDAQLWVSKEGQLLVKTSDGAKGYELENVLVSYTPATD